MANRSLPVGDIHGEGNRNKSRSSEDLVGLEVDIVPARLARPAQSEHDRLRGSVRFMYAFYVCRAFPNLLVVSKTSDARTYSSDWRSKDHTGSRGILLRPSGLSGRGAK